MQCIYNVYAYAPNMFCNSMHTSCRKRVSYQKIYSCKENGGKLGNVYMGNKQKSTEKEKINYNL